MMGLHDLKTISDYKLPVTVYVVTNGGYGMIRQTQADWPQYLTQRVASDFSIPDVQKLKDLFGIDIQEVKFEDTTISPKWRFGTQL